MAELVQGQASVAQSGMKADGFADALHRSRQMAGTMGNEQIPHLNNSPPIVDPSMYGYGGQKRSVEDGESGSVMDRACSLTGTPESIDEAEDNSSVQEMLIPASKVGLVIGRGGDTIKQLQ
ncbi:unnamed protein product, partial [Coregonus sp. 'balchen']